MVQNFISSGGLVFVIAAAVLLLSTLVSGAKKVVFSYYHTNGGSVKINDLDCSQFTHLVWAFANVDADGTVSVNSPPGSLLSDNYRRATGYDSPEKTPACKCGKECISGEFGELQRKKLECPHIKLLVSVGGWSWSHNFSIAVGSEDRRTRFIQSSQNLMSKYGFDGIDIDQLIDKLFDIDWEFPGQPREDPERKYHVSVDDHSNLGRLFASMRATWKSEYLITMALRPANMDDRTNWASISKNLDYGLFMAYTYGLDVRGSRFVFPSGLRRAYDPPQTKTENVENADGALESYRKANFDISKMAFGIPLYSYTFSVVCKNSMCPLGHTEVKRGTEVKYQNVINKYVENGGAKVPRFNGVELGMVKVQGAGEASDIFFIETPETIKAKLDFVNEKNMAGFMLWNANDDKVGKYSVGGYIKNILGYSFSSKTKCDTHPRFCNVECGKAPVNVLTGNSGSGSSGLKLDSKKAFIIGESNAAARGSGVFYLGGIAFLLVSLLVHL